MSAERLEADLCAQLVHFGGTERLLEMLAPELFESPQLGAVATTALEMLRAGEAVTGESLYAELLKRGRNSGANALRFLERHELPRDWDPMRGALRLREAARRRAMIRVGRELIASGEAGDADAWRRTLQEALDASAERGAEDRYRIADGEGLLTALMEQIAVTMTRPPMRLGASIAPLARELQAGQMVTIGGETGAGKSTLALHLALCWHESVGSPAGVVSLEDRHCTWADRWQARTTGTSLLGTPPEYLREAMEQVHNRVGELDPSSIRVAEMVRPDIGSVIDAMRALVRAGCGMVVVDYVQEISVKAADRRNEVTEAARRVKQAAKALRVPLVLCSQLSRGQGGAEPTKKSLKESGDLENMSEAIVLLWRQDDSPGRPTHGKIAKLKNSADEARTRFDIVRGRGGGIEAFAPCSAGDQSGPVGREDWRA